MLATGTATSWWPQDGGGGGAAQVSVEGANGQTVCGELAEADTGTVRILVDGGPVDVALQNVAAIRPVSDC